MASILSLFRLGRSRSHASDKQIILTEELAAELHRRIFKEADDGSFASELENGRKAAARINAWGARLFKKLPDRPK